MSSAYTLRIMCMNIILFLCHDQAYMLYTVCHTFTSSELTLHTITSTVGMARVLHVRNTNMHGKNSAKTERLAVKTCYYYYSAVSLSNKP